MSTPVHGSICIIPEWIYLDDAISPQAKILAGRVWMLSMKEGFCWASNAFFAAEMGASERTVQRWMDEIVDRHFTREIEKGTQRKLWPILGGGSARQICHPVHDKSDTQCTTDLSPDIERDQESGESTLALELEPELPLDDEKVDHVALRDRLWSICPRGSKLKALPELKKAVPSKVSADDIERAWDRYVRSQDDKKYVKHIERWIRDGMWEQELDAIHEEEEAERTKWKARYY